MNRVERDEIVDYVTYGEVRDEVRAKILAVKQPRRIHAGDHLTFLFENRDTIRYQVQEMMRAEQIVKEVDIAHELHTYNELLGGPGEFGCTLLIEIDDEAERQDKLVRWMGLPQHLYLLVAGEDGPEKVRASIDARQVGESRLSSVQYLKFDTRGRVPSAIGCDHAELTLESALTEAQQAALAADLDG